MKTKREQRQEVICRLNDYISQPSHYRNMAHAFIGDEYFELMGEECVNRVIDLLTDDEPDERYIELPVDANGETWHVGDVTENGNVVKGMAIDNTGEWYFINTRNDIDPLAHYHYHKPTVEDVLREFRDEVQRCCDTEDTIAEYAAKLQLKEEVNEA